MFWSYAPLSRSPVSNVWFWSILRALRLVWDYQPCLSSAFCVPQMKLCTLLKISSPFPSPQPLKISLPSASMNLNFVGPHADWTIWWLIILMDIVGFLCISAYENLYKTKTNYTLVTICAAVCSFIEYACSFHPLSAVNESAWGKFAQVSFWSFSSKCPEVKLF